MGSTAMCSERRAARRKQLSDEKLARRVKSGCQAEAKANSTPRRARRGRPPLHDVANDDAITDIRDAVCGTKVSQTHQARTRNKQCDKDAARQGRRAGACACECHQCAPQYRLSQVAIAHPVDPSLYER